MNETNNSKLTRFSQNLRKNMTKEEKRLWYDFLKDLPTTINRQKVIGKYIVDFYCAAAKTVIEIDGYQHYLDEGEQKDKERDAFLQNLGLTVLRYSNRDIHKNFRGVCEDIYNKISPYINT
ncbi:MAG: endonuclease domain-containing protein [Clostridia bacterium]|nr:endonuclease domain-containing protein [Clostridia bacterium]